MSAEDPSESTGNSSGKRRALGRGLSALMESSAVNIEPPVVSVTPRDEQARSVDGHDSGANDPTMYDKYLTHSALMRLGAV